MTMKKHKQSPGVTSDSLKRDLKLLFQTDESLCPALPHDMPEPTPEQARRLFDELGLMLNSSPSKSRWTHPSICALKSLDPVSVVLSKARSLVLAAIEKGWSGPPYDPFALAEFQGIQVLPTESVLDARTRFHKGKFVIEFNPNRPAARLRYSIAHEIGHTLFPDCAFAIRNRATHEQMTGDDWQLESLCNVAAAELLMPLGTLHDEVDTRPTIDLVLELRHKYLVSCEAVVNRLIRVSSHPCVAFFARTEPASSRYVIEYRVPSAGIQLDHTLRGHILFEAGSALPATSKIKKCVAIGVKEREETQWAHSASSWNAEYLGISPNNGERLPRVLALCSPPPNQYPSNNGLTFIKGNALSPAGTDSKLLVQLVNDQAQIWGGGFAKQVRVKWPRAQREFRNWSLNRDSLRLGNIHAVPVENDLTLVSVVAQHGFGKSLKGPRIRYDALFHSLTKVTELARHENASVHMPRIGAGEAGGAWTVIEGIIRETLVAGGVRVTIYDLPAKAREFEKQRALSLQFSAPPDVVDEVV